MSELPVFSVAELHALTNQILDTAFPRVVVEGEIANFRVAKEKYIYFDIKDSEASINCFMTVYQLHTALQDGMRVRLSVRPQLTAWGRFSLVVQAVELAGEGTIKKAYDALRARLELEGLFDPARKRALPAYPRHIALVGSTESAAYSDFIKVASERWSGLHIQVADVQVQGMAAPAQIAEAIAYCNTLAPLPEALVIIRGGGSADDLQAFSTEPVVRAVASSRIPTVVGIGHERDVSLAELAADLRASTPSNAAELLLPDKQALGRTVRSEQDRLQRAQAAFFQSKSDMLKQYVLSLEHHSAFHLYRQQLAGLSTRLETVHQAVLTSWENRLGQLQRLLGSYDPRAVLQRGYALVRTEGQTVRSTRQLRLGQLIMVELAHGTLTTEIKHIQNN
jgi:exodeoxyribonuclease VII large subunit